jgi:membrane protein
MSWVRGWNTGTALLPILFFFDAKMTGKKWLKNLRSLLLKRGQKREAPSNKRRWWDKIQPLSREIQNFLTERIWRLDLTGLTRPKVFLVHIVKVLIFLTRQFFAAKLLTRASALTYSSLLAVVPFLAVMFAIAKGFGLHLDMAPYLSDLLAALGPRGHEIATKILEFVENSQTGALGAIGFATLLLTVFGILNNIEVSYNDIWQVQRMRSWLRRLADYTLLLLFGPLVVFLVLALTAYITSIGFVRDVITHQFFALLIAFGLRLIPYVASSLMFILSIRFVPNTQVTLKAALVGGLFSGVLWQLSNFGIARFVVGVSQASARDVLYAGFAALPLFLLWLYIGWVIALLGAALGYVLQHISLMEWQEFEKRYGEGLRRFIVIRTVLEIVRDFTTGVEVPTLGELSSRVRAPEGVIQNLLEPLVTEKILVRTSEGEDERYLLARDAGTITMAELLFACQGQMTIPLGLYAEDAFGRHVERLLRQIDELLGEGVGKLSLREAALLAQESMSEGKG